MSKSEKLAFVKKYIVDCIEAKGEDICILQKEFYNYLRDNVSIEDLIEYPSRSTESEANVIGREGTYTEFYESRINVEPKSAQDMFFDFLKSKGLEFETILNQHQRDLKEIPIAKQYDCAGAVLEKNILAHLLSRPLSDDSQYLRDILYFKFREFNGN